MIKSHTVTITEIDDEEFALEELRAQLLDIKLLKNTVGIVSAHTDFIKSGVYAAVARAVPFPLCGASTLAIAANGAAGSFLLSILVLTSDDCGFAPGVSGAISPGDSAKELTRECYERLRGGLGGEVKLAFLFSPIIERHYCGEYIEAVSEADARVPVFGTMAISAGFPITDDAASLFGDKAYGDRVAMLLVSGGIEPRFHIASVTEDSVIMPNLGVVTSCSGNVINEINNAPVDEFLGKVGLAADGHRARFVTLVFILDSKDENGGVTSSVSRAVVSVGEGACVLEGRAINGATLSIAGVTDREVLQTARELVSRVTESRAGGTVLMYSCAGRRFAMQNEPLKEYELFAGAMPAGFNFMAACSGTEICPTFVNGERAGNNDHNHTLVACVF